MLETIKTKDYVPDSAWSLNKMDCKPFTPTYILNIVLSHLTPLFDLNSAEILIKCRDDPRILTEFDECKNNKPADSFDLWNGRKRQNFFAILKINWTLQSLKVV